MGRGKKNAKKIKSGVALKIGKTVEAAWSEPAHSSAALLDAPPSPSPSGRVEESPVQKDVEEAAVQTENASDAGEEEEKAALVREILRVYARIFELEQVESDKRARAAERAEAEYQQEKRRIENTQLLDAARALNGRGLIEKLEERWIKLSQHPCIFKMERWERWAVLKEEHADELRAVVVDDEQLITQNVLDNLVPILQLLHAKCVRNQGWFGDRLWIEADGLGKHGGRVLMALAKCFDIRFTCIAKGVVRGYARSS